MTVQDLIGYLQEIEDKTLNVRLSADHSQVAMVCNSVDVGHIEEETYMADEVLLEEYPDAIKVVILGAY